MLLWAYFSFLPLGSCAHLDEINEFVAKERLKAEKNYDKDEHGDKNSFIHLYITHSLDQIIDKYLGEKTMKKLPRKHLGSTYEGFVVQTAAEHREKAAVSGIDTKIKPSAFTKEKLECTDMPLFPHVYEPKKKCSPETISKCFRQNVADFKGASDWDSKSVPKEPLTLVNEAAEQLGPEKYTSIRELALRIREHFAEKVGKELHFASAALEPSSSPLPLSVDGTRKPGTDYSAVFLLDKGSLRFRTSEASQEADRGLILWSSGTENKVEVDGNRLHLRFTCNPDFGDDTLLERLSKRPGKGRVVNWTETGDWRLWCIFLFVLQWMFRF